MAKKTTEVVFPAYLKDSEPRKQFGLARFFRSDSDINYYTGFASYQQFDIFFQFLTPACNFLNYVDTDNTSDGVANEFLSEQVPATSLPPIEEFFLTMVRIRKGLQEKVLADLYGISEDEVSSTINTWVLFLSDRLKFLPIWPTKEHARNAMSDEIKKLYPTTRVIVDCIEMYIEQPPASNCQSETFSAKGLIGISPTGHISFISPLYAGTSSDKKIIRHCGILDILEEGDSLMSDREFDIKDHLKTIGCTLTTPSQDQFIEDQLQKSRSIAAVKALGEREVRKVKEFEILHKEIPISLCPMLEKIWFVCCHLANFTGPYSKE